MTRGEQLGEGRAGRWSDLLQTADERWPELLREEATGPVDWRELVPVGGFPTPALELATAADRAFWLDSLSPEGRQELREEREDWMGVYGGGARS